jgi:hypothetical protein
LENLGGLDVRCRNHAADQIFFATRNERLTAREFGGRHAAYEPSFCRGSKFFACEFSRPQIERAAPARSHEPDSHKIARDGIFRAAR